MYETIASEQSVRQVSDVAKRNIFLVGKIAHARYRLQQLNGAVSPRAVMRRAEINASLDRLERLRMRSTDILTEAELDQLDSAIEEQLKKGF